MFKDIFLEKVAVFTRTSNEESLVYKRGKIDVE